MRFNILAGARSCLIALLVVGLLNLPVPVMAASSKPLGMVVATEHARLDNATAAIGADVYSGDALATDIGGSLRMKVGPSQVYLLSASSATLVTRENRVQAKVEHGTVGFSTTYPEQLEIGTPLGVIRGANSQRVFGQVAVLSATKMQISAYEGTLLVVAANGEQKTIEQGQTYEATLAADPEPGGGQNQAGVGGTGINWKHVAFVAGVAGALGGTALALWLEQSESCSNPPCSD
ncbi:MAG: hypothetical protein P4L00_02745 [Candidatus Acidoferrales bacterium]|nr:hypothetical protein [Candidatus Acidoferrales bacterium]